VRAALAVGVAASVGLGAEVAALRAGLRFAPALAAFDLGTLAAGTALAAVGATS